MQWAELNVSWTRMAGTMNAEARKIADDTVMRPMGWCTHSTITAAMTRPDAAKAIRVGDGS
jgi:hypothetical protein